MKLKVIDVSSWQGKINWEKVKPQIDGAILRCGYGKEGTDDYFMRNASECTRLGIPFGVYLYSYARNVDSARIEAEHVLSKIKPYKLTFPVYYDLEEEGNGSENFIEIAEAFGDIIEKAGYWCGVYANLNWWNTKLNGLERFTKWVAQWSGSCSYQGDNLDMWQYSATGQIDGISGQVDLNICYRDFPTIIVPPIKLELDEELTNVIMAVLKKFGY